MRRNALGLVVMIWNDGAGRDAEQLFKCLAKCLNVCESVSAGDRSNGHLFSFEISSGRAEPKFEDQSIRSDLVRLPEASDKVMLRH